MQARTDFLSTLRIQTSSHHTALEALPLAKKLTSESLVMKDYGHYLLLMRQIIKCVEHTIFPSVSNIIYDIGERRKLHLIETDLETINVSFNTQSNFECGNNNEANAMGFMYVIEGSTLGGRVILKNVQHTLNISEEYGASYFAGYRDTTSEKWKKFLGMLIEYEKRTGNSIDIVAGANTAFKNIYNFINKNYNE